MVVGDPGRIRQIITNLVGNAIKFTKDGEVIIKAILFPNSVDSSKIILDVNVSDTGIGIPQSKCETLFDAFTQVDASTTREYGGTGLGLSIAKQLCQIMGGSISVSSEVNVGSTFNFTIALAQSEQHLDILPIENIKGLRVLLVDDNRTNRKVITNQLALWGVDTVEADSGEAALELLIKYDENFFSMAFIDMQMPHMSGDVLCKKIKAIPAWSSLKLVMLTSMGKRGDATYFADLGFSAYLIKPVIASDLHSTMEIIVNDGKVLAKATPLVTKHYISSLKKITKENCGKVLLVEDNRINQQVAMGILKRLGYKSEIAVNGIEALKMLKNVGESSPFEVVLMDCQMPEMDGYQATRAIRSCKDGSINKDIPIIAMTANAMVGDKEACLDAGMDDYLTKPIDYKLLEQKINHWLNKS